MPYADGDTNAAPLTDAEFAARLDALGPFERAPRLAVAVSGGADSLALALFADVWARARGGRIAALTVDHRLRAASATEAPQKLNSACAYLMNECKSPSAITATGSTFRDAPMDTGF